MVQSSIVDQKNHKTSKFSEIFNFFWSRVAQWIRKLIELQNLVKILTFSLVQSSIGDQKIIKPQNLVKFSTFFVGQSSIVDQKNHRIIKFSENFNILFGQE